MIRALARLLFASSAAMVGILLPAAGGPQPVEVSPAPPTASPPSVPAAPSFITNPAPEFKATGGPYISQAHAIEVATRRARAGADGKQNTNVPIARQAIGFLTYGIVVAWNGGSRTLRIAPDREVYLVVLSTLYLPQHAPGPLSECHWVAVVVDATDGTARELICGPTTWPTNLPAGVAEVSH